VNRNTARPRGLHLDVYRWETDAYPGFHPEGPQGLIDPILKIEECDILIGIFWRRFGTPVTDAKSGTEHEFRLAYEAWKKNGKPQIMVYFSQKSYMPKSKEETDQAGLVLQFKKDFPREGLWWDYKSKAEFETLVRNHLTKFLSEKFPIDSPSPAPVALTSLFQLPPPPADFTGRTTELAELRAAIEKGGVQISGLQGQGGVGKTALALKLAAELAPNFPDAQIYLDLKGVSEKPLTAAEAMSHVLRTFHPEAKLPEKEEDLRALYLSVLHNKHALLLMDNTKDEAQAQPLIPPPACVLLVTSRYHFVVEGLHARNLDTLPPEDAAKLLLRIAPRIDGEADMIAKSCGYLALALRLAAKAIAERIDLAPADYRQKLADEKHRLKLLGGDKGVEASIALSYKLLDAETQKRWRMLAVFPDTFDVPAAAAVWEIETDAAQDALGRLLQFSMLEWNESTKRYRLHDLMRDFARQQLKAPESDAAALRHATHYAAALKTANDLYLKGGDSVMQGLALFDLERENIQWGQAWAATNATGDADAAELCRGFPDRTASILSLRQHPRTQISWCEAALTSARKLKDRAAEGRLLGNLGFSYDDLGDYRRAIGYYEQHLTIAREVGDRHGQGAALTNMGTTFQNLGETRRAIEHYEKALVILRDIGYRRGEGATLGNLGNAYFLLGEIRRAVGYHEEALAILRDLGDRRHEGQALGNLGSAYDELGEHHRAIECHEQALAIDREIGDRTGEGKDLGNLGIAYRSLGDYGRAIEYYEKTLAIARQMGDRRSEGGVLGNLGNAYADGGDHSQAFDYYEQQVAITREIGDRQGEGLALSNMSLNLDKLGNRKKAVELAEAALKILEEIEDPNAAKVKTQLDSWRNG
jgi:tetratricopeptide (TPR) repeat protein